MQTRDMIQGPLHLLAGKDRGGGVTVAGVQEACEIRDAYHPCPF